jgi:hypothetical protein
MPIWVETQAELDAAVADVAALSPGGRTLLSKIIENQGIRVTTVSATAEKLSDLGFIFIRNTSIFDRSGELDPALWGEEALDEYETRKASRSRKAKR